MLARLLSFVLGNRGGLAHKIKYGIHVYCSRALSSLCYSGGSCAICTGPSSDYNHSIFIAIDWWAGIGCGLSLIPISESWDLCTYMSSLVYSTGLGAHASPNFYAHCQCPPKISSSVLIVHAHGIAKVASCKVIVNCNFQNSCPLSFGKGP